MTEDKIRICIDFDGYICKYKGWKGYDNIGDPIKEKIEFIKELYSNDFELILLTTRLNPYPFGEDKEIDIAVKSGLALSYIENWLEKQEILHIFKNITGFKPYADFYFDDRGWNPTKKEFKKRLFKKFLSEGSYQQVI